MRSPALTQADRLSDKHGMSRRSALLILLVTAAQPVYGRRLIRCGGAFEKSCVRRPIAVSTLWGAALATSPGSSARVW